MDLPTCPSCGQSVLDEDVEDCPFCGASMTGKGGKPAVKAASVAARKPPPVKQPPAKPSTAKQRESSPARKTAPQPSAEQAFDENNPFDSDTKTASKAIPSTPNRTKGRSYQVACPMCDTAAYVPRSAAGKDVRCANKECLVPIFVAPKIEKKAPAPATQEARFQVNWLVLAALVLIASGFGVWFFIFFEGDDPVITNDVTANGPLVKGTDPKEPEPKGNDGESTPPDTGGKPEIPPLNMVDLREQVLPLMHRTALERSKVPSKPRRRRLTAEAFAYCGDPEGARNQIEDLTSVGRRVPFFRISPLVALAWKELEANDSDAAQQSVDRAWSSSARLPRFGRYTLDVTSALGGILVAVGRAGDARSLVQEHETSSGLGQLSAQIQAARDFGTFDLDTVVADGPLVPWTAPQSVAVTNGLAARQLWDAALNWARENQEPSGRAECLVAWAEAFTVDALNHEQTLDQTRMEAASSELSAAGKASLFSRVAIRLLAGGKKSEAAQMLELARNHLNSVEVPDPFLIPGIRGIIDLQLPDTIPLKIGALAALDVAHADTKMEQPEAAADAFSRTMSFVRAMAPGPLAIQARLDEIGAIGANAMRKRIRNELSLESDAAAESKLRTYGKQCRRIREASRARFDLQTALLGKAADFGMLDEVTREIRGRIDHPDPEQIEAFDASSLPWILVDLYRERGDDATARRIEKNMQARNRTPDPQRGLMRTTIRLTSAESFEQAADQINRSSAEKTFREQWPLRLACRIAREQGISASFRFIKALGSPTLREDAFEMASALSSRLGQGTEVWELIQVESLMPSERVAACCGLVRGVASLTEASARDAAANDSAPRSD